jgi:neutral ceramidase
MSSALYNAFASREQVFDRALFEFLAHRIAQAIIQAAEDKGPATVSFGEERFQGLARNLSFEAFRLNPKSETESLLQSNTDQPLCKDLPAYPQPEACRAINPIVSVVRFDSLKEEGRPIAIAAFVAIHNTTMKNATEVYHSDFFGVAADQVARSLTQRNKLAPVVAIFNGAEGDISPAWSWRDRRDAIFLGQRLGELIASTKTTPLQTTRLGHRFMILEFDGRCFQDRSLLQEDRRCLAAEPDGGIALIGGAEDGYTPFHEYGWAEGIKGPRRADHGPKLSFLDQDILPYPPPLESGLLRYMIRHLAHPPDRAQIGIYQLGSIALATLPGEFTVVMGRRTASAIARHLNPTPDRVLLIGLANEYISYFPTPEEYDAQHYEGAATLYGPNVVRMSQHV